MRTFLLSTILVIFGPWLAACGGGDDDGSGVGCESIPTCYSEALDDLKACMSVSALTISGGTVNSGVVQGRECSAETTMVAFSDYSASATGTVPISSRVSIYTDGELCAELSRVSGSKTGTTIIRPGQEDVFVGWWPGGRFIECGPGYLIETADLAECPEAVQLPEVERDPLAVRFRDADDSYTDLFVCQ